jgi:hypothetical protein
MDSILAAQQELARFFAVASVLWGNVAAFGSRLWHLADWSNPLHFCGAIALAVLLLFWRMNARWRYWKKQGQIILEPGKIGPKSKLPARIVRYILGRIGVRFSLGKVTIVGRRNLWYYGRIITFGPHYSYLDTPLAIRMMKLRPMRYFIAREQAIGDRERVAQIKGFAGIVARWFESLRTALLAYTGGIVVDRGDRRATSAALDGGVNAMDGDENSSFVIFPQGKIRPQSAQLEREQFFPGAFKLGKKIERRRYWTWIQGWFRRPQPEGILVWAMFYDTDPAHRSLTHCFISDVLGFQNFRRLLDGQVVARACCVFGTVVPFDELPDDANAANDILFARLVRYRAYAEKRMKGGRWMLAGSGVRQADRDAIAK